MTPSEARSLAANLVAAAARAESEGRAELSEADLDLFAVAAETGLAALDAALAKTKE